MASPYYNFGLPAGATREQLIASKSAALEAAKAKAAEPRVPTQQHPIAAALEALDFGGARPVGFYTGIGAPEAWAKSEPTADVLEGLSGNWKKLATLEWARHLDSQKPPDPKVPTAYRRFDWETPGSALAEKNWTAAQGAAAARGLLDVNPNNKITWDTLRDANFTDPGTGHRLRPEQIEFLVGLGQGGSQNDLHFQSELKNFGLTKDSSDADLAAGYDAIARAQQFKNQLPKRGLDIGGVGNFFASLAAPAIGLATGNPAFAAALGGTIGAATHRGNPLDTALGALGGYGAGKFGASVQTQGFKNAVTGLNPLKTAGGTGASKALSESSGHGADALGLTSNPSALASLYSPATAVPTGLPPLVAGFEGLSGSALSLPNLANVVTATGPITGLPDFSSDILYSPNSGATSGVLNSVVRGLASGASQSFINAFLTPRAPRAPGFTDGGFQVAGDVGQTISNVIGGGNLTPAMETFFTPQPSGGQSNSRYSVYRDQMPQLMNA